MKSFKLFSVIKEHINVVCEVSIADLWVFAKYQMNVSNCSPMIYPLTPYNVVFSHCTPLKSVYQKLSMIFFLKKETLDFSLI